MSNIQNLAKTIDINKLPFVLIDDRNNLPNDNGGCYFVKSKNTLLYIGQTTQDGGFRNRWSGHHRLQQMLQFVNVKIHYYICSDDIALELEGTLIKLYDPLLQNTKVPSFSNSKVGLLEQKNILQINPVVVDDLILKIDSMQKELLQLSDTVLHMSEYIKYKQ